MSLRASAVRSGLITAASSLAVSGSAVLAGVLLARRFGRGASTDGLLAAYAVYTLLVTAAQSFRIVAMPDLTRAAAGGRLAAETRAYLVGFSLIGLSATAAVILWSTRLAQVVTGGLPFEAAEVAARALVWLVPAAFVQLLAALVASALAARDSYAVAAVAHALGGVAGLGLFALLSSGHGAVTLAWGVALNGAVTLGLSLGALARHEDLTTRVPSTLGLVARLRQVGRGAALPLAIQGHYLIGLRAAAGLGVGHLTSLSYAYLVGAALVSAAASSLALVSSVPLTRRGLDARRAAAHVIHTAWLSVVPIGASAGTFALLGPPLVRAVLGDAYAGMAGAELSWLVACLGPWMLLAVALSTTFPLLFVVGRTSALVLLAVASVAIHLPLTIGLRWLLGFAGIPAALALSAGLVLLGLLAAISRRTLADCVRGLSRCALVQAGLILVAFGLPAMLLDGLPAALAALTLYGLLLQGVCRRPLREAWRYLRGLHEQVP